MFHVGISQHASRIERGLRRRFERPAERRWGLVPPPRPEGLATVVKCRKPRRSCARTVVPSCLSTTSSVQRKSTYTMTKSAQLHDAANKQPDGLVQSLDSIESLLESHQPTMQQCSKVHWFVRPHPSGRNICPGVACVKMFQQSMVAWSQRAHALPVCQSEPPFSFP